MRLKDFFKELTTIDPEVKAEIEREEREKEKILLKMKMILLKSYFLEKELLALSFEAGVCDVPKLDAEDMECFKFELLEKCLDIRELEKENPEQAFKEYEKLINAGYF
ncbi:MAG: hypothetical protein RR806_07095, partial [Oscillospiraceae bacterium]